VIEGLYRRLVERARGRCECGVCGRSIPPGIADHFFGRAKAEESEATVWMLHTTCDYAKTRNSPDASHWFRLFAAHCDRYGYFDAAKRARARLDFVDTRRGLGSALGARR
jgi:hypothetical protein